MCAAHQHNRDADAGHLVDTAGLGAAAAGDDHPSTRFSTRVFTAAISFPVRRSVSQSRTE